MRNRLPLLTACILLAAAIANTIASASSAHAAQDTGVAALDGELRRWTDTPAGQSYGHDDMTLLVLRKSRALHRV